MEINMRLWGLVMVLATAALGSYFAFKGEWNPAIFMAIMNALGWAWLLWGINIVLVRRTR